MVTSAKINSIIFSAVQEFNETHSPIPALSEDFDRPLFGMGGQLDSLGLVNLIVAVEQQLENAFGVAVVLASERAMSERNSPFRTLAALRDYTLTLLQATKE